MKLSFFGITDGIWNCIINRIDLKKNKLVSFVENDNNKIGLVYKGYVIKSPNMTSFDDIDYIIVTALSAYKAIKKQLLDLGVSEKKIVPFIAPNIFSYDLELINIHNSTLYINSQKIEAEIRKYNKIYEDFAQVERIKDKENAWYLKSRLISHACGGIVNGEELVYSNSKEALEYSLSTGFTLIECDVMRNSDNDFILCHHANMLYQSKTKNYTLLSLTDILEIIRYYPDVRLLIDYKYDSIEDYSDMLLSLYKIILHITDNAFEAALLKQQIVMEVYNEPTIKSAAGYGYEMFYTQYKNPDYYNILEIIVLCNKYSINTIGYGVEVSLGQYISKAIKIFAQKNIKVFTYSTDSPEIYSKLLNVGIYGIFTNLLRLKTNQELM